MEGDVVHTSAVQRHVEPLAQLRPQAAKLFSVRPSWVADAARGGHLPCVRIGKHVRFLRSDLERWVGEQRT
jgi:excisionase family DNA binding protein